MLYVLNIASAYCLKSLVDRTDSAIDGQFLDVMGVLRSYELAEGFNSYVTIDIFLLDYACIKWQFHQLLSVTTILFP